MHSCVHKKALGKPRIKIKEELGNQGGHYSAQRVIAHLWTIEFVPEGFIQQGKESCGSTPRRLTEVHKTAWDPWKIKVKSIARLENKKINKEKIYLLLEGADGKKSLFWFETQKPGIPLRLTPQYFFTKSLRVEIMLFAKYRKCGGRMKYKCVAFQDLWQK